MYQEYYRKQYHKVFTEENIARRPYAKLYQEKIVDVLRFVRSEENGVILDVGCGYGRLIVPIVRMRTKWVVGMDISEEMIKKAMPGADVLIHRDAGDDSPPDHPGGRMQPLDASQDDNDMEIDRPEKKT